MCFLVANFLSYTTVLKYNISLSNRINKRVNCFKAQCKYIFTYVSPVMVRVNSASNDGFN